MLFKMLTYFTSSDPFQDIVEQLLFWLCSGLSKVLSWPQRILANCFLFNMQVRKCQTSLWVGSVQWLLIPLISQRKSSFWKLLSLKLRSLLHLYTSCLHHAQYEQLYTHCYFLKAGGFFVCSRHNKIFCRCLLVQVPYVIIKLRKGSCTMQHIGYGG